MDAVSSTATLVGQPTSVLSACRACLAPDPYLFLPLGLHSPAQMLIRPEDLARQQPSFPLNAQVCLECGLIQIADQIPPDFFRHYLYVPSGAATMHEHFRSLATVLAEQADGGLIADIGCNDGLLLAECNRLGCRTLGIDPAANIAELAREKGVEVEVTYFDPQSAAAIRERHGRAEVIVTTNTFNHIGDLHGFMRAVDELLAADGTFVIEVPRAKELIEQNEFDNIYHEHVSEFSLLSLVKLGAFFGLQVTDVHRLPHIHGGSMRAFLRRSATGLEVQPIVAEMLDEEAEGGMLDAETYDALAARVENIGSELRRILEGLKVRGLRIAGYGASARGNTMITHFGIGAETLDFMVDKNPLKHGLYSPNTRIPILPVEELATERPDVLLVLAWNFLEEIQQQQSAFLERGGKFVVALPTPRVIS